jgi:hypothetical protein
MRSPARRRKHHTAAETPIHNAIVAAGGALCARAERILLQAQVRPSNMTPPEIPENLRGFIHDCIPHVDAAEVLLALSAEPDRSFTLRELVEKLRPAEISEATVHKYLARFEGCGLVAHEHGAYRFTPASSECELAVSALAKLYNERPVTLVRMIYAPKEDSLRAFADAFRIKKP